MASVKPSRADALVVETEGESAPTRFVKGRLDVWTRGAGFTDVTPALRSWLTEIRAGEGLLSAFVSHTTASLVVQENADPDVRHDLLAALARIAPARADYRHGLEGPDDMPGHIKATVTDTSAVVPVAGGALQLGMWQALYLVEHRSKPLARRLRLSFIGN